MLRSIVAAVVLSAGLVVGVSTPATSAPDRGFPPCMFEDGSGQSSCVWDAAHRGNGVGRSFIVFGDETDETFRFGYVSHERAHRMVAMWRADNCERVTARDYVCPSAAWNMGGVR